MEFVGLATEHDATAGRDKYIPSSKIEEKLPFHIRTRLFRAGEVAMGHLWGHYSQTHFGRADKTTMKL
jgi:hypothetical protein